jgi:hypothetical protein
MMRKAYDVGIADEIFVVDSASFATARRLLDGAGVCTFCGFERLIGQNHGGFMPKFPKHLTKGMR